MKKTNDSTEEKIKEAARKLFQEKGFIGTKTRDIAKESGINIALLNYYFRSKQKLFDIIMAETVKDLFLQLLSILEDSTTSIEEKLEKFVGYHIEMLMSNPNLPFFILSSSHTNKAVIDKLLNNFKEKALRSSFAVQYKAYSEKNNLTINPLHYLINIIGLTVSPFTIKPLLESGFNIDEEFYLQILEERKVLVPLWIAKMNKG